ncbi:MAG: adenosine deaminase [Bacilli bacterium]|nr:adenosine deaminase [Bacilli bacterium]
MNLNRLPKILQHVHLDGSVRIETANELLNKDVSSEMMIDENCKSLSDYLTKFKIPISLMQTKDNLIRVSYELGIDLLNQNVIYVEVRFCPLFHINEGLSLEEVVDSILKGLNQSGIKFNLILCMMREFSYEKNKQIINLANKYLNKGVCAIDLAGDEGSYPTKNYRNLFELASSLNIPFTIHAGEADGCESISSAIEFGAKRIGHGVRTIEYIDLINEIREKNITLEVCPTSNIDTMVYSNYKEHPIKKLYDLGVKVTINTDNNTVSNISLNKEYEKLKNVFNFKVSDFIKMNIDAINSCFISDKEKKELILKYRKEVQNEGFNYGS